MKTRLVALALTTTALMLPSLSASAEPQTHDGLMLRIQLGGGTLAIVTDDPPDTTFGGGAAAFNLALGYSIIEDLAIYGEFSGYMAPGPTLTVDGVSTTASEKIELSLFGLGVGVTYYAWEGLFVGLSLRSVQMRTEIREEGSPEDGTILTETDPGVVSTVHVGYEWWVGSEWALGVGLEAGAGRVANERDSWMTRQAAIVFSSTLN